MHGLVPLYVMISPYSIILKPLKITVSINVCANSRDKKEPMSVVEWGFDNLKNRDCYIRVRAGSCCRRQQQKSTPEFSHFIVSTRCECLCKRIKWLKKKLITKSNEFKKTTAYIALTFSPPPLAVWLIQTSTLHRIFSHVIVRAEPDGATIWLPYRVELRKCPSHLPTIQQNVLILCGFRLVTTQTMNNRTSTYLELAACSFCSTKIVILSFRVPSTPAIVLSSRVYLFYLRHIIIYDFWYIDKYFFNRVMEHIPTRHRHHIRSDSKFYIVKILSHKLYGWTNTN